MSNVVNNNFCNGTFCTISNTVIYNNQGLDPLVFLLMFANLLCLAYCVLTNARQRGPEEVDVNGRCALCSIEDDIFELKKQILIINTQMELLKELLKDAIVSKVSLENRCLEKYKDDFKIDAHPQRQVSEIKAGNEDQETDERQPCQIVACSLQPKGDIDQTVCERGVLGAQQVRHNDVPGVVLYKKIKIQQLHLEMSGPFDTSYKGGFYFIHCPLSYPIQLLRFRLMSTGNGRFHFKGNLYRNGKVWLTIIGMWCRPAWNQARSLSSLLRSIKSLVEKIPDHKEPVFEQGRVGSDGQHYNTIHHEMPRVSATCNRLEEGGTLCPDNPKRSPVLSQPGFTGASESSIIVRKQKFYHGKVRVVYVLSSGLEEATAMLRLALDFPDNIWRRDVSFDSFLSRPENQRNVQRTNAASSSFLLAL